MEKIKFTRVSISPSELAYMTDFYTIKPNITIYALLKADLSFSIHQKWIKDKADPKLLFSGKGKDERNAKKLIFDKLIELGLSDKSLIQPIG